MKDHHAIWESCLRTIRAEVTPQSFATWFAPIVPLSLEDNTLTIQVPSQFFYEWLEEHYLSVLRQVIHGNLGPTGKLAYSIIMDTGSTSQSPYAVHIPHQPVDVAGSIPMAADKAAFNPFDMGAGKPKPLQAQLNPLYCFDNFIEGGCNRLAKSAAQAVASRPSTTAFNPFVIHGGVGLGKTHLIQAIGQALLQENSRRAVLYLSAEQFTTQFVTWLKRNKIQEFMAFYTQADVLLIDDIQFFGGKDKTQEAFFHIFNHLHQTGKQLVMTSDTPPKDLQGLQERLLSRFKWGLTSELQAPDSQTRMAIISHKMQQDGIQLDTQLTHYLAHSIDTNIRELEGVLVSLIAYASINKRTIDIPLAKQVLKGIVKEVDMELSVEVLQHIVSRVFQVKLDDLRGASRRKEVVMARQAGMFLAREYTPHSLKSIGHYFGRRDHSTVVHALQTVRDMLQTDPQFAKLFRSLLQEVKLHINC